MLFAITMNTNQMLDTIRFQSGIVSSTVIRIKPLYTTSKADVVDGYGRQCMVRPMNNSNIPVVIQDFIRNSFDNADRMLPPT